MKILFVAGRYKVAGFSTVMEKLADALIDKGHDVTIAAFNFQSFPSPGKYGVNQISFWNLLKLRNYLESFDIIHSHHAITNYLAFICNKTFIFHCHGAPNFGRDYIYRLSLLTSLKLTSNRLTRVIVVSEVGRRDLVHYLKLNRVDLIYNGVDTKIFNPNINPKFRKGRPQFLFVGNLYVHKNVAELLFAFKKLLKQYPDAHLEIIGLGLTYKKLKKIITRLNIFKNVTLGGRVTDSDLPSHYTSSDVYVTASQYEVCPVPLLESMACGKPIVASSILPHVDLLNKSNAGKIYSKGNIDDLATKMIDAYEQSEKYAENAILFAKKHDWSCLADKLVNIYKKIAVNF